VAVFWIDGTISHVDRPRYDSGLTDYLNVLDAERWQFELEAQYVISRRMAGIQLVILYKAPGGANAIGVIRFSCCASSRCPSTQRA
jgi:hypothetical protein